MSFEQLWCNLHGCLKLKIVSGNREHVITTINFKYCHMKMLTFLHCFLMCLYVPLLYGLEQIKQVTVTLFLSLFQAPVL